MQAIATIRTAMRRLAGAMFLLASVAGANAEPTATSPPGPVSAQRGFASAQEAADAFIAALGADDAGLLDALFGPQYTKFEPTDKISATVERKQLAEAAHEALLLREDALSRITLVIGAEAWPFPIPIVESNGVWRFDTAAGIEELMNRIIGKHELAAIDLLHNYVDAQAVYASEDRDGDQVLEYAQRITSTPGQKDGLYWKSKDGDLSPFGPFVSDAGDFAKGRRVDDPYRGYYYKVLKRQGPHPPGGAYDYVINGNMIAGFALLAWPADYGSSGVMTFVVNQQGKVFQKNLGPKTAAIARGMTRYDPDASWTEVTD